MSEQEKKKTVTRALWRMALPGEILLKPVAGGLSLQLEMAESTERYEAVAVIDGKINIFSVSSDKDQEDSIFVLGEGNGKVYDSVSNQEINLPRIDDLDDVSFYQALVRDGISEYQVIITSIKASQSLSGTGVTFATVLKVSGEEKRLVPAFEPFVLDWNYFETSSLKNLVRTKFDGGLYAPAVIAPHIKSKKDDPAPLKDWRTKLKKALELNSYNDDQIPYVQVSNRRAGSR